VWDPKIRIIAKPFYFAIAKLCCLFCLCRSLSPLALESDRSRYGAALERTCYNNGGGILERTSYGGGMLPDPDYRQSLSRSSSITSDEGIILGIIMHGPQCWFGAGFRRAKWLTKKGKYFVFYSWMFALLGWTRWRLLQSTWSLECLWVLRT